MDRRILRIQRSHVGKHTGYTKTEGSEEELPLHEDLYGVIEAWRTEQTEDGEQPPVDGWLFGNLITGRPFWRGTLPKRHLIPAWQNYRHPEPWLHDFRHTYSAMMDELKISLEEQRTLVRHEDGRTTLGYGGKSRQKPAERRTPGPGDAEEKGMIQKLTLPQFCPRRAYHRVNY
jgi:integrase